MKLVARIAMVGCWMALAGCGVEDSSTNTAEVQAAALPVDCPTISMPTDGYCPNGNIQSVYEGKCLVGYKCVENTVTATALPTTCPNIAQPTDKFCPNGTIQPVYEGKCLVGYKCIE